jgi:hypothetical protein
VNVDLTRAWLFLIAFPVIGTLTIIEGVNDGFTVLNWVVIAVSVVIGLQAVWSVAGGSSQSRSASPLAVGVYRRSTAAVGFPPSRHTQDGVSLKAHLKAHLRPMSGPRGTGYLAPLSNDGYGREQVNG